MKKYLVLFGLIFCFNLFAQIPIGEDLNKGKTEIKNFLTSNGFNLIKESEQVSYLKNQSTGEFDIPKNYWEQTYKEEMSIWITPNKYENIEEVYFFPENDKNRSKLLEILKFNEWEFLYDQKDFNGIDKVYKYNNYYALLLSNGDLTFKKQRP